MSTAMPRTTTAPLLGVLLALSGCASTTSVQITPAPQEPVCQPAASARVLWVTKWRADQKDVPAREEAVSKGIHLFFDRPGCFASVSVERLPDNAQQAIDALVTGRSRYAEAVVVLAVRELGPTLKIGSSPALVEGGTEVVLDIAEYPPGRSTPRTFTVWWRDGGPGTVKGVATLPQDLQSALAAGLQPGAR